MNIKTLSSDDGVLIINALYAARDKYRECAKIVAAEPGHEQLSIQFQKQADACDELINRLEG